MLLADLVHLNGLEIILFSPIELLIVVVDIAGVTSMSIIGVKYMTFFLSLHSMCFCMILFWYVLAGLLLLRRSGTFRLYVGMFILLLWLWLF